jgi:hypothetical protein
MPNGTVEEAGQTARQAIIGLSGNPVILALVLLQICMLGGLVYINGIREHNNAQRNEQIDTRFKLLINRCVVDQNALQSADGKLSDVLSRIINLEDQIKSGVSQ